MFNGFILPAHLSIFASEPLTLCHHTSLFMYQPTSRSVPVHHALFASQPLGACQRTSQRPAIGPRAQLHTASAPL